MRTAVVTGGTSGIGLAIVRRLAHDGYSVLAHGKDPWDPYLADVGTPPLAGEVDHVACDLTEPHAAEALVGRAREQWGHIDVLVNNAGTNVFAGATTATLGDWDFGMNLLLRAPWLCAVAAARHMPRGGAIVNIGSNHAHATVRGTFPYNVAKAGLEALTKSLAIDLADRGIRANTVVPGWTRTPLTDAHFDTAPSPRSERSRVAGLHLTGRIGEPDDVAAAVAYLAGADAGQVTGTTLLVDGGRSALMEDPPPDGA